ncbi:unnamed protein product, partial [Ectocarpus sp. 12 AP-2014]
AHRQPLLGECHVLQHRVNNPVPPPPPFIMVPEQPRGAQSKMGRGAGPSVQDLWKDAKRLQSAAANRRRNDHCVFSVGRGSNQRRLPRATHDLQLQAVWRQHLDAVQHLHRDPG